MVDTKERLQKDIADTFDFARFVIKHPRMLGKIKNGAVIRFVPSASITRPFRAARKTQAFSTETVFHSL